MNRNCKSSGEIFKLFNCKFLVYVQGFIQKLQLTTLNFSNQLQLIKLSFRFNNNDSLKDWLEHIKISDIL